MTSIEPEQTYTVQIELAQDSLALYTIGQEDAVSDNIDSDGILESGIVSAELETVLGCMDYSVDFGFVEGVAVGNLVFHDLNDDGDFDSDIDTGLVGVTVQPMLVLDRTD